MTSNFHRGHAGSHPAPGRSRLAVLRRAARAFLDDDDLWGVSAGVAFYAWFAAVFGAVFLVSLYALGEDPRSVGAKAEGLRGLVPEGAIRFLAQQMQSVAEASKSWLWARLAGAFVAALWSARAATASMIAALNITHNQREERGFVRLQVLTLALTVGGAAFATAALALAVLPPSAIAGWQISQATRTAITLMRWPMLAALMCVALGLLYRFGPCRGKPQWRWVSGGALVATILWTIGTVGFSLYLGKSSANNQAFGALYAVLVMQTWFYITALAVVLGAKLNAEAEHETETGGGKLE